MRAMLRGGVVGAMTLVALGALAQEAVQTQAAPELERARAAAAALSTELRARLMEEMKAGGPLQGV